jgi:plastocyanin
MNIRCSRVGLLIGLGGLALGGLTAAAPSPHPATAVVHIRNFAFVPASLVIAAGTAVTFVNDDGEAHTVTAADRSFDSAGLDTNDSWKHVFAKPGTYAYFCALHPTMRAEIVVRPSVKERS